MELILLVVFVTLICSVCTGMLVPFRQLWLHVDPKYFKRVKVKFPAFLFVGIGGSKAEHGNVKNYGVIVPMFVLHILGYILTLLLWAAMPVLYYRFGIELDILVVVPLAVALPFTIIVVVTEAICVSVSRKRHREELEYEQEQLAFEQNQQKLAQQEQMDQVEQDVQEQESDVAEQHNDEQQSEIEQQPDIEQE